MANRIFRLFIFRDYPDAIELKKIRQIVKERRKARHDSATAQEADGGVNVNDNADSICWFCHADVTNLANNKCAGCRKVRTHLCLQILTPFSVSGSLL